METPTNPYQNPCQSCKTACGFGLVWVTITNRYQVRDLGRGRSRDTFTNHYRRTEGRGMTEYYIGLELVVGGAVDEGDAMLFFIG